MRIISAECPGCGAKVPIDLDHKAMYCPYCRAPLYVDDESTTINVNITNKTVDEARIKELELEQKRHEDNFDLINSQNQDYNNKYAEWKHYLMIWLGALAGTFILTALIPGASTLFGAVLIFGGIAILVLKPKGQSTVVTRESYHTNGSQREIHQEIRYEPTRNYQYRYADQPIYKPKSRAAAFFICLFFGFFGGHMFYVGKIGKGIIYMFTAGLFGIGWFVDMFRILGGHFTDSQGHYL